MDQRQSNFSGFKLLSRHILALTDVYYIRSTCSVVLKVFQVVKYSSFGVLLTSSNVCNLYA
jgi:hypothetical protein